MSKGDAFDFAAKILQTGAGTDREKFLARAVVRLTNETTELKETLDYAAADIAEMKETIKEQDALLNRQGVALDDASMELSELKDKLRWRKQDEEPAPKEEPVLCAWKLGLSGEWMHAVVRGNCLEPGEYWRPLDTTEEKQCRA